MSVSLRALFSLAAFKQNGVEASVVDAKGLEGDSLLVEAEVLSGFLQRTAKLLPPLGLRPVQRVRLS